MLREQVLVGFQLSTLVLQDIEDVNHLVEISPQLPTKFTRLRQGELELCIREIHSEFLCVRPMRIQPGTISNNLGLLRLAAIPPLNTVSNKSHHVSKITNRAAYAVTYRANAQSDVMDTTSLSFIRHWGISDSVLVSSK
jgi:hypothetical protein